MIASGIKAIFIRELNMHVLPSITNCIGWVISAGWGEGLELQLFGDKNSHYIYIFFEKAARFWGDEPHWALVLSLVY